MSMKNQFEQILEKTNQFQEKPFCQHYLKLEKLTLPATKESFAWICLQNPSLLIKENLSMHKLKQHIQVKKALKNYSNQSIFINKETLAIYCIKCKIQILDLISEADKADIYQIMKTLGSQCFINPLVIRSIFMMPYNNDSIFSGNLEYPQSFHKFKKGLTTLISSYRNQPFVSVLHLLSFFPTISRLIQEIDLQKIQNQLIRQIFRLIQKIISGKYRILKTDIAQKIFLQLYPNFKSYQERTTRNILFQILKHMEEEFSFQNIKCDPKTIIKSKYFEWNQTNKQNFFNYSLIKELFFGKCEYRGSCPNCQRKAYYQNTFQCLKLSLVPQVTLRKKQVNVIKLIEQVFNPRDRNIMSEFDINCVICQRSYQTEQVTVSAGNYLFLQLNLGKYELQIPKQINLTDCKRISVPKKSNSQNQIYELVGYIFKKKYEQSDGYIIHEIGTCVYQSTLKKYITFEQLEILQAPSLFVMPQILVYKKKVNPKSFPLIKNIKSTLLLAQMGQLIVENPIPLPDFYVTYLEEHHTPAPIINPYICLHQNYNLNFHLSKAKKIHYVPLEIYQFLIQQYGGQKIINKKQIMKKSFCLKCQKIKTILKQIKIIEKATAKYVDKNSNKKSKVLIYKPWLEQWKKYLYFDKESNYKVWGNRRPQKIDNFLGLDRNNIKNINYNIFTKISGQVWFFLQSFYGGGPLLIMKKYNVLPSVTSFVNYQLKEMIQKLKSLKGLITLKENQQTFEFTLQSIVSLFQQQQDTSEQKNLKNKSQSLSLQQSSLDVQKKQLKMKEKQKLKQQEQNLKNNPIILSLTQMKKNSNSLSQIDETSYQSQDQNHLQEEQQIFEEEQNYQQKEKNLKQEIKDLTIKIETDTKSQIKPQEKDRDN